jgi:hypothetical protein
MHARNTLAAGVMAALLVSAPFAHSRGSQNPSAAQDEPAYGPDGPLPVPTELHFCALHCLTFTLQKDGKLHNYTNLPDQRNEDRV